MGLFLPPLSRVRQPPIPGFSLALGDLDGDGITDLVVGNYFGPAVSLYVTRPTETATASAPLSLSGVGEHLVDASYAGDTNYASSVSGTTTLWGVPPATATTPDPHVQGIPGLDRIARKPYHVDTQR